MISSQEGIWARPARDRFGWFDLDSVAATCSIPGKIAAPGGVCSAAAGRDAGSLVVLIAVFAGFFSGS